MFKGRALALVPFVGAAAAAFAQEPTAPEKSSIDPANSVWIAVCTALVLLMTPALALFYAGMVRRRNVLSTMLHSFVMMGVVSILWIVAGYTIAFGKSANGLFGGFEFLFGNNVSMTEPYGTQTIPAGLFMLFQMMFAVITPALISGAIAERMKFSGYVLFTSLWSLVIYSPVACWVWNADGWLFKRSALDFAGGTVVHLASGASALAACLILGKRRAVLHKEPILPNNLTMTLLGAGLLWFGWIGFNAGSALALDGIAINAFATTHLAAAAGMLGWLVCEKLHVGKPTALGAASGLVAGLVGITPGAGFLTPISAIFVGALVGVLCCLAVSLKHKMGFDDSLDVVGVHGVGGLVGAILTGVLASPTVNAAVETALKDNGGRGGLIFTQVLGVVVVGIFAFVGTLGLMKVTQLVTGIRATKEEEDNGLDLSLHGEAGYNL